MSATTAYQCDGPGDGHGCPELTTKAPGTRYPSEWPRLTIVTAGGTTKTGAFHSQECATDWVRLHVEADTEGVMPDDVQAEADAHLAEKRISTSRAVPDHRGLE